MTPNFDYHEIHLLFKARDEKEIKYLLGRAVRFHCPAKYLIRTSDY